MVDADAAVTDRGDVGADAFMDALGAFIPDAYRLAYGMLRSREDAGDVVQEATLSAWRHRGSLRPEAQIRPWFLAIVANECRQAMRQRWWSVIRRPDLTALATTPAEARVDDADRLRQGLRRLAHADRLVLVLRYYLDLSFTDVAATLRISPAAARVRTHRALARLRPIIGATEDLTDE